MAMLQLLYVIAIYTCACVCVCVCCALRNDYFCVYSCEIRDVRIILYLRHMQDIKRLGRMWDLIRHDP